MKKVCSRKWRLEARRAHYLLRRRIGQNSRSESLGGSSLCFCRLYGSILWRRAGLERVEKPGRDRCNFIHRSQEGRFVYLRRLVDSADFSDELERRCPNLFRGNGWLEVEKSLDVSAHRLAPYVLKFEHFKRLSICVSAIRQRWAKRPWPIQDPKFTRPGGPG
jgi:hypothetical protein